MRLARIETSYVRGEEEDVLPAASIDELNALAPADFFLGFITTVSGSLHLRSYWQPLQSC